VSEPLSSSLAQFPWVSKRDGRLVPFDADKISRALFAATEGLGQPDAFLARELTDAVLHFLAAEADGSVPATGQIADTVVKVVRELGHPRLSQEFAAYRQQQPAKAAPPVAAGDDALLTEIGRGVEAALSPPQLIRHLSRTCLRAFSLGTVFSRDLVAAHHDGLLTLGNLEAPLELAGCVLPPPGPERETPGGWIEWIVAARSHVGDFLALDGPEYTLLESGDVRAAPDQYARELRIGLAATGLRAVVNLNAALPPPWVGGPAEGPLFAGQQRPPEPAQLAAIADALLEALLPLPAVRIDWHLGERDFLPEMIGRLARVARRVGEGAAITFVLDRSRRPLGLGDGLDRQHSAALLTVGLNLPRLAEHPRLRGDLLPKLGSLVRMALSAAAQKREFLRRHTRGRPALTRGFLLQRARLVLAPVGLESAVRQLQGRGLCDGGPALDFARQVLQRLRQALRADGAAHHLDTCLDGPASFCVEETEESLMAERVAGATVWDVQAPMRQQLKTTGQLHAAAETGTAALRLPAEQTLTTDEIVELLRHAWQKTDVVRLRFVRAAPMLRQQTASWSG
jgi:hypothetical protein